MSFGQSQYLGALLWRQCRLQGDGKLVERFGKVLELHAGDSLTPMCHQEDVGHLKLEERWCGRPFAGPKEVGHKPALIVAVSASRGGSYPVNELRTSGYKNNRLVYIPEHVLVQDVADVLNGETSTSDRDAWLRRRIEFADRILLEYARALAPIRSSGLTEHADFPYGM